MPIKRHKMNELTLANKAAEWSRLKSVPLRKPPSKQLQCFMIFTKCPISRLFITSCHAENGSKMNFATEPKHQQGRLGFPGVIGRGNSGGCEVWHHVSSFEGWSLKGNPLSKGA
jgi:hypothetical protein